VIRREEPATPAAETGGPGLEVSPSDETVRHVPPWRCQRQEPGKAPQEHHSTGRTTYESIERSETMKKLLAIAAAVVLAVGTLTFGVTSVTGGTGAAFASASGIGGSGSGVGSTSQNQGKGTTTTQYKSSYTDPFFGPVSCTGVHQFGKNTGSLGNDSFTCTSTTGLPLTNVTAGEILTLATFCCGWISDYYSLLSPPQTIFATSFNGTVSGDGMSYTAVATY
jgi:hypothetical protein